ncbi:MAG: hypothetical protein EXS10_06450 [Phycisphaerales bacterium]|nr:hypothetical protein [Phycisphaerales bacterium]
MLRVGRLRVLCAHAFAVCCLPCAVCCVLFAVCALLCAARPAQCPKFITPAIAPAITHLSR